MASQTPPHYLPLSFSSLCRNFLFFLSVWSSHSVVRKFQLCYSCGMHKYVTSLLRILHPKLNQLYAFYNLQLLGITKFITQSFSLYIFGIFWKRKFIKFSMRITIIQASTNCKVWGYWMSFKKNIFSVFYWFLFNAAFLLALICLSLFTYLLWSTIFNLVMFCEIFIFECCFE